MQGWWKGKFTENQKRWYKISSWRYDENIIIKKEKYVKTAEENDFLLKLSGLDEENAAFKLKIENIKEEHAKVVKSKSLEKTAFQIASLEEKNSAIDLFLSKLIMLANWRKKPWKSNNSWEDGRWWIS